MYDSIYAQEIPEQRIISDLLGYISSIFKDVWLTIYHSTPLICSASFKLVLFVYFTHLDDVASVCITNATL